MTPADLIVFGLICILANKLCLIATHQGIPQRGEAALFFLASVLLIDGGFFWWLGLFA